MISRAVIHIAGPTGVGKTTLVERLLAAELAFATCIRGELVKKPAKVKVSEPADHPELKRYLAAGAGTAFLYRFPRPDVDAFYDSMAVDAYSEALFVEGDCPTDLIDLSIFVAPYPRDGESLVRRVRRESEGSARGQGERSGRSRTTDQRQALAERLDELGSPLGLSPGEQMELMKALLGESALQRAGIALGRHGASRRSGWVLADSYEGIERAGLVVINLREGDDPARAEALCGEVHNLRKNKAVFEDVVGFMGNKVPITAVVVNLASPKDRGFRKALNRVKRALRSASE